MGLPRSLPRLMEHFWLAVAIGTLLAALWVLAAEGFDEARSWLPLPAIALAMFLLRRAARRRLEAAGRGEGQGKA